MKIKSRNLLSNKSKRQLLVDLIGVFGEGASAFFTKNDKLEIIKTEEGEFIIKNGKISFFHHDKYVLPTIKCLRESNFKMPKITVDIGAIKFILNGADIMAPGIVFFDENIVEGEFVAITEEKAGSVIGVGQALVDYKIFSKNKKGKVVKNIHHLKDYIWDSQL